MSKSAPSLGTDERRLIHLDGGPNFRDLGGYPTHDGRQVKWRRLFRSGSMSQLTEVDREILLRLSIKTVCDLRTTGERKAAPNTWCQPANVAYWSRDYEMSFGNLGKLIGSGSLTAETARAVMIEGYRQLPFEQAPAYRELLLRLAAEETPLVFNCSAGKDRTGTAAAVLLSALGVPKETIVEDYVLTNQVVEAHGFFGSRIRKNAGAPSAQSAVIGIIMSADAAYLQAALDAIEDRHGGVAGYVRDELGIGDDAMQAIRLHLLEMPERSPWRTA